MRAFAVKSFGDAPGICELQAPAADDSVLIRVSCAGVNPVDQQLVEQLTARSSFPFVVGVDVAGVVERVPAGDHDLHVGDRVFGMARTHGSYAEYTAVALGAPTEPLARIPDGVSDEQAAALPVAAVAALGALELLAVAPGETLLVLGAAGAVGGYAVQMAVARGARVVASVRGSADASEARRLGAAEVHDVGSGGVARALQGAGADAVLDIVNGRDASRGDAEFLTPGGRLVSTIFGADVAWFAERRITAYNIIGHPTPFGGTPNPRQTPQGLAELARMLATGTITARIRSTARLDGAAAVLAGLRDGSLRGKAVIRVR
ncbi:MAG: zinc-binding dehydrogenase [Trebonia sp.]|jgi:NADPH:quinone reductase-like Zn-dependent oxidoreductase